MQVDLEQLRQHYRSLSDEALLAVERDDLIDAAQACYDAEVEQRGLGTPADEFEDASSAGGQEPDWLSDASVVFSQVNHAGSEAGSKVDAAREALDAAGIPCYVQLGDIPEGPAITAAPVGEWSVSVPGKLNQRAASVLDRDIFNQEFEDDWRGHLGRLSDDEVLAMEPQEIFCGLLDRMERVTNAYNDELARRGLKIARPSIWSGSMETFYEDLAAPTPAPAAVTAAAVSARLGMALLIKVLEIVGRRRNFTGDIEQLNQMLDHARLESAKLATAADEDITADAARKRNDVPMSAARAAEAGMALCEKARPLVTGAIAADLAAAVLLLRAGVDAIHVCVRANAAR